MEPRWWKTKVSKVKAIDYPISKIVSQLQASLINSNSRALLSDKSVLLKADVQQTKLLKRACFGPHRDKTSEENGLWCACFGTHNETSEKNGQRFPLCMEEAFYLQCSLKCIKVDDHNDTELNSDELWNHMISRKQNFPILFKAYSHLRTKNWVVRSGRSNYGVDFVAYRHHPDFVHSEYAVLVLSSENNGCANDRLRVWSDYHGTVRLCDNVAKTLLILDIETHSCETSPSCLDNYVVRERTVTRWIPEQGLETKVESDPSLL